MYSPSHQNLLNYNYINRSIGSQPLECFQKRAGMILVFQSLHLGLCAIRLLKQSKKGFSQKKKVQQVFCHTTSTLSVSVLIPIHTNTPENTQPLTYTGHVQAGVNRNCPNSSLSPVYHCKMQTFTAQQLLAKTTESTCNWLPMLLSTLLAEANAGCFLLEGGPVIRAWQIASYVRTEKTQSASGCECHCFKMSQFILVQTKTLSK